MRQRSGVQRKPLMQMVLHSYTIRTTTSCTPMPGGSPTPSSRRAGMAPPYRECGRFCLRRRPRLQRRHSDCVTSPLLSRAATSIYSTTCILCSCQMTRGRATTGSLPRTAWTEPRWRTTRRHLRGRLRGATAMGGLVAAAVLRSGRRRASPRTRALLQRPSSPLSSIAGAASSQRIRVPAYGTARRPHSHTHAAQIITDTSGGPFQGRGARHARCAVARRRRGRCPRLELERSE